MAPSVIRFIVCLEVFILACPSHAEFHPTVELQTLSHFVVYDAQVHQRPENDQRNCIWTDDHKFVPELLAVTGKPLDFEFAKGQVLAVFFNDDYNQELTQIVHNKSTGEVFADYARSGILKQLAAPKPAHKYSRITIVTFSPMPIPPGFGVRGMINTGFSEKKK